MQKKNIVLLIDDDVVLLKMAEEMLRDAYDVSLVKSGKNALRLLTGGFTPDIILLDVDMPTMDGYETIRCLRELENCEDIPIIFLTGFNQPEAELKGLNLGAADYVTKPFVKEILFTRMELCLKNAQRQRRLRILEQNKKRTDLDPDKLDAAIKVLTDTERKIMGLMALGFSNQEIAQELCYSYSYVKKVAAIILNKLNLHKRNELKKMLL
ncbi:MAG: response regulator [Syntrophomonadaceae bacterium]|nr:response regulator [Syntrophomonadaceae bacterium]